MERGSGQRSRAGSQGFKLLGSTKQRLSGPNGLVKSKDTTMQSVTVAFGSSHLHSSEEGVTHILHVAFVCDVLYVAIFFSSLHFLTLKWQQMFPVI